MALEEIVLKNLREAISYVSRCEGDFVREMSAYSADERDRELSKQRADLAKAESRAAELDAIIRRLYEDNVSGKLTDERFIKLSRDYEREQNELKASADAMGKALKAHEQKKTDVRNFVAAAKKYTDLRVLDAGILREFVDRIEISAANRTRGERKIHIVYNFIGAFDFGQAAEQAQTHEQQRKSV